MAIQDQLVVVGDLEDPYFVFDNHDIVSVEGLMSCAIGGENLAIDTLAIEVNAEAADLKVFKPSKKADEKIIGIRNVAGQSHDMIFAKKLEFDLEDKSYTVKVRFSIPDDAPTGSYFDILEIDDAYDENGNVIRSHKLQVYSYSGSNSRYIRMVCGPGDYDNLTISFPDGKDDALHTVEFTVNKTAIRNDYEETTVLLDGVAYPYNTCVVTDVSVWSSSHWLTLFGKCTHHENSDPIDITAVDGPIITNVEAIFNDEDILSEDQVLLRAKANLYGGGTFVLGSGNRWLPLNYSESVSGKYTIDKVDAGDLEYSGIETSDQMILAGHYNYNGSISELDYGTSVYYFLNDELVCCFYIDTVERVAKGIYKLNTTSLIGIFDKQSSFGGVYSGESFSNVAEDIIYSQLKSPYEDAEYISCDGNQCLRKLSDKHVSFFDSVEIVFDLKFASITGEECLFGNEWMSLSIDASHMYIRGTNVTNKDFSYVFNNTDRYLIDLTAKISQYQDPSELCTIVVTNKTTEEVTTFTYKSNSYGGNNRSYYYFAYNSPNPDGLNIDGDPTNFFVGDIYSLDVYQDYDEKPVLHSLRPVIKNFSNAGELYDSIEDYYNASITNFSFIPGPVIQNEEEIGDEVDEEIDIEYGEGIADIPIYGFLPLASKRANLYQLLCATNVNLIRKPDGGLLFDWLSNDTSDSIEDNHIYDSGKVTYINTLGSAKVTEHSYLALNQSTLTTLYDNTESIYPIEGDSFVSFSSAPIILSTIQTTGSLMIREINENCAYVYGRGTLVGIPYTHVTNVVSKSNPSSFLNSSDSEISDVTLVSAANSQNVLNRLFEYKSKKQEISGSFTYNGEKCGKCFVFKNPYSESVLAFINKLTLTMSAIVKADYEAVKDYIPVNGGNNFKYYVILTGSGTWYVPENIDRIRVILIGGAYGGDSGFDGETPDAGSANGGYGGEAGYGGASGRILVVDIDELDESYIYSAGHGGEAGVRKSSSENDIGKAGTETSFGEWNTLNGSRSSNGVQNMFTGEIYALPGIDGISGGQGSHYSDEAESGTACDGESVYDYPYIYHGGRGWHEHWSDGNESMCGGGGAAVGNDGKPSEWSPTSSSKELRAGNGADAVAITEVSLYGCGGHGGHGGGGGGAAKKYFEGDTEYPGTGGKGTDGTKGGDGCILIYY